MRARWLLTALGWLLAACGGGSSVPVAVPLGSPNPGLDAATLASFENGREIFEKRFTRDEGHGPHFNTSSCRSCHEFPVTGGSSPLYRNFFVAAFGTGSLQQPVFADDQFVLRLYSYVRTMREALPEGPGYVVAQRNAPPMFGIGLLERIPLADILVRQDPVDADGDGISGRPNFDSGVQGRFGYKAQEAQLEGFLRGPLFNHMGITTDPLSFVASTSGRRAEFQVGTVEEPTRDNDGVPDPELGRDGLLDLLTFVRELAPPAPAPMDAQAADGELLFEAIGCADCHVPNLVRDGAPVRAYTDLLLHDMGPELADGMRQGVATGAEWRTQPLWGLRHHAPYLHDGRADTMEKAILLHGGEASDARDAFEALDAADRAALLRFLETR